MTEALVPDWIKRIKEQRDMDSVTAQVIAQQQALLAKTIEADGPTFWRDFLKDLQITVDSLDFIGLRAQMTEVTSGTSEDGQQILVFNPALLARQTHTNIFYGAGATAIRCHPQDKPSYRMEFCLNGRNELAVSVGARGPMTATEATQYVVEPMAKTKT